MNTLAYTIQTYSQKHLCKSALCRISLALWIVFNARGWSDGPFVQVMDSLSSHHTSEHCTRLMSLWQTCFKLLLFFFFFCKYVVYPLHEIQVALYRKSFSMAATWTALPRDIHIHICYIGPWRYSCLPVCVAFSCVLTKYDCQDLNLLMCTQVLMRAIAHGGC